MSTIGAPPPPPTTPVPTPVPAQPTATAPLPPQTVAQLAQGAMVDVTVLASKIKGQAEVMSDLGQFSLRTNMPLAEGAKLSLQVMGNLGQQIKFRVTALNGQPLLATTGNAPQTGPLPGQGPVQGLVLNNTLHRGDAPTQGQPQATAQSGAAQTVNTALTRSDGLSATVIRGAAPNAPSAAATGQAAPAQATPGTPAPLVTGTQMTVRIAAVQVPQTAPSVQTAGPQAPAQATPAQPAAPTPTGAATPTPVSGQPVQNAGTPQPTMPHGAYAQSAATATPTGPYTTGPKPIMTINGTVAANTAGTQTVVNTPQGLVALNARLDVPAGTNLTLDIMTQTLPSAQTGATQTAVAATATGQAGGPPFVGGSGWPNVTEALTFLDQTNPDLAKQLRMVLPQADSRMAATMIAFTNALRAPVPTRIWPGDPVLKDIERLGPKGDKLAKGIAGDLAELAASAREPRGDWRAMNMPFLNGAEIEKITLYVHRDPDETEQPDDRPQSDGERFLIDLELSKMGAMQLDGYVVNKDRRFDLIIRTEEAVDQEHRRAILGIFNTSVETLGLTGQLNFLVTRKFVTPEQIAEGGVTDGLIV